MGAAGERELVVGKTELVIRTSGRVLGSRTPGPATMFGYRRPGGAHRIHLRKRRNPRTALPPS